MKVFNKVLGLAVLAIAMTACGNNQPISQPVTGTNTGGYYNQNGQWVQTGQPGQMNGGVQGQGGCVPLQSALTFTANGAQMSSTSILAGSFPQQTGLGTYGQVMMGASGYGQGQGSIQYQPKQGQNGTLQLFAGSANGMGTVTGTIQLAPYIIQQLGGMQGNFQNPQQQGLCVNSIALWAVQTLSGQTGMNVPQTGFINQAVVYLYLSNGQAVGPLQF